MKFEDLEFQSNLMGIQARHDFPNGYGVSVVKGPYSYGGDSGLYELAVMKDGLLTDDVLGRLTPAEVTSLLARVEALPPDHKSE